MEITKNKSDLELCCKTLKQIFPGFTYTVDDLIKDDFVVFIEHLSSAFFILHLTYDYVIFAYSYIAPEFRGLGNGTKFTNEVIKYAKRYSRPIKTTIRLTNIPSYKIALNTGFIPQHAFVKEKTTWIVLQQ